jgi:hypothetical protein
MVLMERKGLTFNDKKYGHPYTLGSVRADLEDIKKRIGEIEKQFCAEIYTVRTPQEAEKLFSRLTKMVKNGTGIELIVRRL